MANTDFKSVGEYIARQPEASRAPLERVRAAIRKALPQAQEVISYEIPAYKNEDGFLLYFAGWKEHYSLYPATDPLIAAFKDDLGSGEVNKRTLKFPLSQPVPARLIARIAKFKAAEAAARATRRGPAVSKR